MTDLSGSIRKLEGILGDLRTAKSHLPEDPSYAESKVRHAFSELERVIRELRAQD